MILFFTFVLVMPFNGFHASVAIKNLFGTVSQAGAYSEIYKRAEEEEKDLFFLRNNSSINKLCLTSTFQFLHELD